MTLVDHRGDPIAHRKAPPPKTGEKFGVWAGREDVHYLEMPGGQVLQFDLSRLTLGDYRAMREHYQINASLAVLMFMMHQLDWHIESPDKKLADEVDRQLREMWTPLIRGLCQAYWAGYSPMVLQWENNLNLPTPRTELSKVKDLPPEECRVHWKQVKGWAPPNNTPPKLNVFDGIDQRGISWPIPVENSLWYPLLMENGDYYGKKLLKPAFPSWFFSILIHLFANRYYERFGEPLPIGRAPFDDEIPLAEGGVVSGRQLMIDILTNLRNRGVVVLPADRSQVGGLNSRAEYDYDLEYLESQMRGADFERYLGRLDEEMSLSIFTPVLLFRTADVGSYNLGVGHMQIYLWMLNALAGDLKSYLDPFVVRRIVVINSPAGFNSPPVKWVPRKLGKDSADLLRAVVAELIRSGAAKPDLDQLGQAIGLTLSEVRQVTVDPEAPDETSTDTSARERRRAGTGPRGVDQPRATAARISSRLREQVEAAWKRQTFGTDAFRPSLGYRRRFENALIAEGCEQGEATKLTEGFYGRVERWADDALSLGRSEYSGPDEFTAMFDRLLDSEIERLASE